MTTTEKIPTPATSLTNVATKPVAKPAVKATVKKAAPKVTPTPKATVKTPAATKPVVAKQIKAKKPKLIRDSLTMPKMEYEVLTTLKLRAIKLANPVKKTELIRAGIKAIAAMSDAAFLAAIKAVPSLKTGRPAKSK